MLCLLEISSGSIQFNQILYEAEQRSSVCGEAAPPHVHSAHWRCAGAAAAAAAARRLSLQHSFMLWI